MSENNRNLNSDQSTDEQLLNITSINSEFRAIAEINRWQSYHTPKNLAAAVAVEASELLAEFQWLSDDDARALDAQKKAQIGDEVADVIMYLTELCAQLGINIPDAVHLKAEKNKQRFKKT